MLVIFVKNTFSFGIVWRSRNGCEKKSLNDIRFTESCWSRRFSKFKQSALILACDGIVIFSWLRIRNRSSSIVFDWYGALPNKHSYSITPMLQRSALASYRCFPTISGAIYSGEPLRVSFISPNLRCCANLFNEGHNFGKLYYWTVYPKSATLRVTIGLRVNNKFWGFKSKWLILFERI